jgi:hypothetical protein
MKSLVADAVGYAIITIFIALIIWGLCTPAIVLKNGPPLQTFLILLGGGPFVGSLIWLKIRKTRLAPYLPDFNKKRYIVVVIATILFITIIVIPEINRYAFHIYPNKATLYKL